MEAAALDRARALLPENLALEEGKDGLVLCGDGMRLHLDFHDMLPRVRPDRLGRELLVKAAKLKHAGEYPLAIDATAGLGEDALLLAAAGFRVRLYERNPVIAVLLRDALERAAGISGLSDIVARMELLEQDSVAALAVLPEKPDVVYLDPMFPARKKSAAVKKKFQLLHRLEAPCSDAEQLLAAALGAHPRKVVVKRPLKGPNLTDAKPAYSLRGTSVRYDVFVCA